MVMVCFLLLKLRKYIPLNVQTQCWAWIKLATDNFSTVFTRNRRNPRDYAPLSYFSPLFLTGFECFWFSYVTGFHCLAPVTVFALYSANGCQ